MRESTTPNQTKSGPLVHAAQLIFILWLLFVNVFYYLQFRELFLARFGSWIHRWR